MIRQSPLRRLRLFPLIRQYDYRICRGGHPKYLTLQSRAFSTAPQEKVSNFQRLKSFFVKGRPWTLDDFFAIGSWVLIANGAMLLVGTTTFVSIWLGLLKTLPFQDRIIESICEKLTRHLGVGGIKFESALANWQNGTITLRGVRLVRNDTAQQLTCFDIQIDSVDLDIDLLSFVNQNGLLIRLSLAGVRGVIDRRHLDFTGVDPSVWLSKRSPSPKTDQNLKHCEIKDLHLTIYDINGFRPYSVTIYRANFHRMRTQWLLYDLLGGEISGEYDGSMFNLSQTRIKKNGTITTIDDELQNVVSKFRLSGLRIDMLNASSTGPFGWITSGTADFDVAISFPADNHSGINGNAGDRQVLRSLLGEIEKIGGRALKDLKQKILNDQHILKEKVACGNPPNNTLHNSPPETNSPMVEFFVDTRFNNIRATVPSSGDSFGMSDILVRSIVAYLNSQPNSPRHRRSSTPPLSVEIKIPMEEFNGSWTLYQCGLMDLASKTLSDALVDRVYRTFLSLSTKVPQKFNAGTTDETSEINATGFLYKFGWWAIQQLSSTILSFANSGTGDTIA